MATITRKDWRGKKTDSTYEVKFHRVESGREVFDVEYLYGTGATRLDVSNALANEDLKDSVLIGNVTKLDASDGEKAKWSAYSIFNDDYDSTELASFAANKYSSRDEAAVRLIAAAEGRLMRDERRAELKQVHTVENSYTQRLEDALHEMYELGEKTYTSLTSKMREVLSEEDAVMQASKLADMLRWNTGEELLIAAKMRNIAHFTKQRIAKLSVAAELDTAPAKLTATMTHAEKIALVEAELKNVERYLTESVLRYARSNSLNLEDTCDLKSSGQALDVLRQTLARFSYLYKV